MPISRKMDGFYTIRNGIPSQHSLRGLTLNVFNSFGRDITGTNFQDALVASDLDWSVSKLPIYAMGGDHETPITTNKHFAVVRNDTSTMLGIVGPDYTPIQNEELAYLCERVAVNGVKLNTAGFLNGGQRVWMQLEGDSFGVGPKGDEVVPTTLFTNGHDGQWPLSSLPTSYRVICQNTLNMALSSARKNNMIISLKHVGNVSDRLEQMVYAIENWKHHTEVFQDRVKFLGNKEVTTEMVQEFWVKLYSNMFGTIHSNPQSEESLADNKKATSVITNWCNTFDSEVKLSGANMWTAMNAVTYWLDHEQIYRGNNKRDNKFNDILFGNRAKQKIEVLEYALAA